ncbi:hypothetical protein [Streptomyces sp. SLBN-8D4]|uniref:hypothetical protein n=1 Tax=Streptomyces sp. SLBN-8D4 TaxID=3377728 RepID=UPI003C7A86CD
MIARLDGFALRLAGRERRLIGLALMRLVIGFATIPYCLADYSNRQFLWGPHAYNSPSTASGQIPGGGFSLYLLSDSQAWFELLFHATILVSAAFMVFGGRMLTVVQAVLMWSLHYRNQDLLEGGDNLAQILVIFLTFTVSNAYFAPGAKKRREKLLAPDRTPAVSTVLHNLATYSSSSRPPSCTSRPATGRSSARSGRTVLRCTTSAARPSSTCRPGLPTSWTTHIWVRQSHTRRSPSSWPSRLPCCRAGLAAQGQHPRAGGDASGHRSLHGPRLLRAADDRRGLRLPA